MQIQDLCDDCINSVMMRLTDNRDRISFALTCRRILNVYRSRGQPIHVSLPNFFAKLESNDIDRFFTELAPNIKSLGVFGEYLTIHSPEPAMHMNMIMQKCHQVQKICLHHVNVDSFIGFLPYLQSVESMCLKHCTHFINALKELKNLRNLYIFSYLLEGIQLEGNNFNIVNYNEMDNVDLNWHEENSLVFPNTLERLYFNSFRLFSEYNFWQLLPNLKILHLRASCAWEMQFHLKAICQYCPNLEELNCRFPFHQSVFTSKFQQRLVHLRRLGVVNLSSEIAGDFILMHAEQLLELNVFCSDFPLLAKGIYPLKELRKLDCDGSRDIDDISFNYLCALPHLDVLITKNSTVSHSAVFNLLQHCRQLKFLDLTGNKSLKEDFVLKANEFLQLQTEKHKFRVVFNLYKTNIKPSPMFQDFKDVMTVHFFNFKERIAFCRKHNFNVLNYFQHGMQK